MCGPPSQPGGLDDEIAKLPELMDAHSTALIVARLSLAHAAISRRTLIISAERPPWIVRA
jgi:hypothetical protein